ncbi:MAG TPA: NUDIX hydrolase [Ktedonobacterales bacterium]|jgi:8-oxo-dGTP diphosphatase
MTALEQHPSLYLGGAFSFIFNSRREFLILRENPGRRKYDWDLPGGTLEHEESPLDGLTREIYEETGLQIRLLTPACFLKWDRHESGHPILVAFYLSEPVSDEVTLSREHVAFRWVSRSDLDSGGIHLPPSEQILDAVFNLYRQVTNCES